jgi:preprotein translocase subunit SecE
MKEVIKFLQEVRLELAKITWPSMNELIGSVIIVIIIVCAFSVYLGVIDFVLYKIAGRIF